MPPQLLKQAALAAMLAAPLATALAAAPAQEHAAVKRAFDLPPSADLEYAIKARQKGFTISGHALVSWRTQGGKYSLVAETRAPVVGKILENRSEGTIDAYGIAPARFYEKRFRRDGAATTFDRGGKTINFAESRLNYPLKGGEQDRASAQWQLAAVARGAPEKFTPGSQWTFFVAGRRDAEPWTFKVVDRQTVRTGIGPVETVHLKKAPPDARDQEVDIWLAPGHEWYPVRVRFSEGAEYVEQTLEKITRK